MWYKSTLLAYHRISKWKWNWKRLKLREINVDLYLYLYSIHSMKSTQTHNNTGCVRYKSIHAGYRKAFRWFEIRIYMVWIYGSIDIHTSIFPWWWNQTQNERLEWLDVSHDTHTVYMNVIDIVRIEFTTTKRNPPRPNVYG